MNRWTWSRTNSSNRSEVLLAFGFSVVGFLVSMTGPPSRPGFEPGGLGHPRGYAAQLTFTHNFKLPRIFPGLRKTIWRCQLVEDNAKTRQRDRRTDSSRVLCGQ